MESQHLSNIDGNNDDLSQMFISFNEPWNPNALCHIQRSYSTTASSPIVAYPSFPTNCPFQAWGQFSHWIFVTSKDPDIPSIPCTFLCLSMILWALLLVSGHRFFSDISVQLTIPTQNLWRHQWLVDSPIWKYSLNKLKDTPYPYHNNVRTESNLTTSLWNESRM